ncbi:hypothetical protein N7466_009445 [Penicillium verhagenii]|uniref:uncharacterized protein n=1 Tax=Penicillium verhagenii TaxID=1562060 RepID=UPI0025452724|nr:uncharacterized protein N7466_009445 [Penicillium verhagenii]KAJ5921119.1 hypothetical protein N7466_009445 [Penicillium verhagenii]
MKSIAILSSLLFLGTATAQTVQSNPFHLVITQAAKKSLNGEQLSGCHSGAGIESLCLAGQPSGHFYFNTTKGEEAPIKGDGLPGVLIFNLPYNGDLIESEPMSFYSDPSTNVAMPMFEPGYNEQEVSFNGDQLMGIYSYLNDAVTPPTGETVRSLKNWYVCETYYEGYTYMTLNWVLGNGSQKPQNPSCVKVEVQRKFL